MKKCCLLTFYFILTFLSSQLCAQKDSTHFVTKWHLRIPSNDSSITIYTDTAYTYNYDIDWNNDGVFDTLGVQGDATHYYSLGDTVSIRIRGNYPRFITIGIYHGNLKFLTVEQWGTIYWKDMSYSFMGCRALQSFEAADTPRLDSVTDMNNMFTGCRSFNDNINHWDVSSVTDMSDMFHNAISFNQPIGNWDVSSVTDMNNMFHNASSFNQPIGNWDVSSVTDMSRIFYEASSFNQSIGNWDVSSVTDMSWMFYLASSFNQPIGNWDVSSVTDMSRIFHNASSFNQPIGNWDVSSVTDMSNMFVNSSSFNQPIGNWDVSSVTDMGGVFYRASSFNQPIGNWDVSSVIYMDRMFYRATSFNQAIGSWDVSSVTYMNGIFQNATNFNQPIGNWDVSSVTDMRAVFKNAVNFNQDLSNWNIANVSNMSNMLDNTALSIPHYDSLLIAWQAKPHKYGVNFGVLGLEYCNGNYARVQLKSQSNWQFNGHNYNCNIVGLNENKPAEVFSIYPIPSQGELTVEVSEINSMELLEIYNTKGNLVKTLRIDKGKNKVDLSNYSNGLYLFKVGEKREKVLLSR